MCVQQFYWHSKWCVKSLLGQIKTGLLTKFSQGMVPVPEALWMSVMNSGLCILPDLVNWTNPALGLGTCTTSTHLHVRSSLWVSALRPVRCHPCTHSSATRKVTLVQVAKLNTHLFHTVQSSIGRKVLCITLMISILLFSIHMVCHWKPGTPFSWKSHKRSLG